jgi:hypothetical protein
MPDHDNALKELIYTWETTAEDSAMHVRQGTRVWSRRGLHCIPRLADGTCCSVRVLYLA